MMSPYRDPSPFETSTGTPGGEYALLEASIVLEASGTHELAVLSGPGTITTTNSAAGGSRSEYILLATAQNGVTGGVTAGAFKAYRVCVRLFKQAGKGVSTVVIGLANSGAAVPEDDEDARSVGSGDGVEGTSDSVPIQTAKEVRFNQALWGLESMSRSLFIKAYVDGGAAEDAPEDVVARVDSLFEDCGDGECHDGAMGDVLASSFILINVVRNNLDGEGRGYLQMQGVDENNRGEGEVVHCGTGFQTTRSA